MNNRPDWCPYTTCIYLLQSQDKMCVGRLPEPQAHNEGINTHRFCLDERETGHGIHDLLVNTGDLWNMHRLFSAIKKDKERTND